MDSDRFDPRTDDMELDASPIDDYDDNAAAEKSSKHRSSRDRKKSSSISNSSSRREEKEHRSKDRDRDKDRSSKDKDYEHRHKDRDRDREREKEKEKDRKERGRDKERDVEKESEHRVRDKDRSKESSSKRERGKEKEREKHREKEREIDEKSVKEKEKEVDYEKEKEKESRSREKERGSSSKHDHGRIKDDKARVDGEKIEEKHSAVEGFPDSASDGGGALAVSSTSKIEERIAKAREERLKKKSEGASEILSWVSKSRKLEEKRNAEKEKAWQLSRMLEEQDNIGQEDSDDDGEAARGTTYDLAGVKVLHGLEKVAEGGAVVLTLKDQDILANGDINKDVDMLENAEIGEQKRRDEAYKAAKKNHGIYDDKFNDDPGLEKKILPQYDDPAGDEGVTLDTSGQLTVEAEKKLEELRRRLQGASSHNRSEDLNSSTRILSDYYTQEEMLQFKKPKKKKSLRKKEKLDIDALEAEAVSAGLGAGDLGSRKDGRRQAIREEQEKTEAEMRKNAYQSAVAKAEEASKLLRVEQTLPVKAEEEDSAVIADDDGDLYKSLERARKLALKKQYKKAVSGPEAIALHAATMPSIQVAEDQTVESGEQQENKIVITEMEEFVWGLQVDEETRNPDKEDVFMDEDEVPESSENIKKDEAGGWTEVKETEDGEMAVDEQEEEIVPDETIHEAAVGKGLSGALKLLKERGTLKETVEWGGRNMDKKKSKLVGIVDNEGTKEIRIERTDEFGRILTPKEAFRLISHKFHGKGPGKMKLEKRMKQYHEELKLKTMKNSDTPSLSVERMREAQAQMKTPYLVLSGHVKPGQDSDPRSGFATVEKDPGSLTPMLGDRKVEHFLGIKRKPEAGNGGPPKKPKP